MIKTQKSPSQIFALLEIITVYSKNETKLVNAAHGRNVQFINVINVQAGGTVDSVSTGSV